MSVAEDCDGVKKGHSEGRKEGRKEERKEGRKEGRGHSVQPFANEKCRGTITTVPGPNHAGRYVGATQAPAVAMSDQLVSPKMRGWNLVRESWFSAAACSRSRSQPRRASFS